MVVHLRSIKKIFERPKEVPSDIAQEIPVLEVEDRSIAAPDLETEPIYVKSMELRDVVEVQEIVDEVRRGNILVVDIEEFLRRDPSELRRAVDEMKEVTKKFGGDIGKLTDTKIIITPKFIKIQFRRAA